MSMYSSPHSNRESPGRRIGVILSILFLTSLGTVASLTSARAVGHEQASSTAR
jgi:hypothetical protein